MSNLRNGSNGGFEPGSLDCESGILPLSYRAPHEANHTILIALVGHGQQDEPSEEELRMHGCEQFLCSHFCPHWGSKDAQVFFVQATQR